LASLVVTTVWAAPPSQSPTAVPTQTPSALRGEVLWADNCAPCHGISGRGDGPTAQSPQMAENPPTDFTDRAAARQRSLADMFVVTKEGRMDRLMPPWGGQLSDDEIWDVVTYAQTFATTAEEIAAGKTIYEANCVACHAADGSGAVPGAPDFTEAGTMASQASQALFEVVGEGRGEMPSFEGKLSEDQQWQVVDYLRPFSYAAVTFDGVIAGQVQNATTGQPVGDVEVRLRRWQGETELPSLAAQADSDGNIRFEGLDTRSQAFYRAEVIYDGVSFPADFANFEPDSTELTLPLRVYETTTSDEAITVERLHFIVMDDQPGLFSVLELYQFSNQGDRAYVGTVNEEGLRETVRMALPAGAQNLFLQGGILGVDFLETDEGLVATSPVVPGVETFEAALIYLVPFSGKTLSLDRTLNYDTVAVNGLLLDMGAKVESDVLTFGGERTAQGQTFLQYNAQNLKAGQTLPIRLNDLDKIEFASASGSPGSSKLVSSAGLKQNSLLWAILGLGAAAIVLGVVYPSLQSRLRGETPAAGDDQALDRQRLLLTIARLDQAYEAGELNEAVYQRARTRRKAELADVLRQMQEDS